MKVRAAIGLHCSWVWIKTGSQKGSKMRYLKLLTLLGICSVCLVAVPYAHAQRVGAGSGVARAMLVRPTVIRPMVIRFMVIRATVIRPTVIRPMVIRLTVIQPTLVHLPCAPMATMD